MDQPLWQTTFGDGPLVACAIHNGTALRPEAAALLQLPTAARVYEEDPFTGGWTSIASTRIVGQRSRFEIDLNRPRESAVYLKPEDAWGLRVWKSPPSPEFVARSLAIYDDFYAHMRLTLERLLLRHSRLVVFDLHSYNHRRQGPTEAAASAEENPEINVGTGSLDRARWAPVVDRFLADMSAFDYLGRRLDVRENIRFRGGHFSQWIHANFGGSVCALAIEVKKFFMDEWTGQLDTEQYDAVGRALQHAAAGVLKKLETGDKE